MKNIIAIDLGNHDIYQHKVWGDTATIAELTARDVSEFGDDVIGEVFLASTHKDGKSTFANGKNFDTVIAEDRSVFGDAVSPKKSFPLLLKILSAKESLSLQTHYKNKIEAWVTLTEGEILYGLTPRGEQIVSTQQGREELHSILKDESDKNVLAEYFNLIEFVPGQAFIVHAGMAHALLKGTVFEPQKNSNLTLRGGDWGRNLPNRPLDKEDFFLSLYPFSTPGAPIEKMYKMQEDNVHHACIFATQDFALDEIVVDGGSRTIETFDDRFFIAMVMGWRCDALKRRRGRNIFQGSNLCHDCKSSSVDIFWERSRPTDVCPTTLCRASLNLFMSMATPMRRFTRIGGPVIKENDIYIQMKEVGLL